MLNLQPEWRECKTAEDDCVAMLPVLIIVHLSNGADGGRVSLPIGSDVMINPMVQHTIVERVKRVEKGDVYRLERNCVIQVHNLDFVMA
jgi:hypothetical protein